MLYTYPFTLKKSWKRVFRKLQERDCDSLLFQAMLWNVLWLGFPQVTRHHFGNFFLFNSILSKVFLYDQRFAFWVTFYPFWEIRDGLNWNLISVTTFWIFSEVSLGVCQEYTNISEHFGRFSKLAEDIWEESTTLSSNNVFSDRRYFKTILCF